MKYPLPEVLLLCLLAVIAGAETITDIARFGEKKLAPLRRFRPFREGTPAHDHLGDILATLNAEPFQCYFVAWVASLTGVPEGVIAIDGKTVRRSKGVDRDAMGCQRAIARKVVDRKANYILALKGNQGRLRDDVELFAEEQKSRSFQDTTVSHHRSVDGDHGRIETRNITVFHDVGWLQADHRWPALNSVVMVESTRETGNRIERETRFYITCPLLVASLVGPLIRDHWAVENSLHWVLDMVFRDDECRLRTDHAPANFTTLKHMALNLIRKAPGKDSIRLKRKVAARDDDFLTSVIAR